jgi:hypothetical protein
VTAYVADFIVNTKYAGIPPEVMDLAANRSSTASAWLFADR